MGKRPQCLGMSRQSGQRCRNQSVPGSNYCKFHGGGAVGNKGGGRRGKPKPPGSGGPPPKGSANALKHGIFSARLPEGERGRYEELRASYEELFCDANAIDKDCIHRLAMFQTKLEVAIEKGAPGDSLEALHRMIHREMKALQATRESKDSSKSTGTSPAEVIAVLLSQAKERAALPRPRVEVIDVESREVTEAESDED